MASLHNPALLASLWMRWYRLQPFDYIRPHSLEEASQLLAQAGKRARVLAGGADLLIKLEQGLIAVDWVLDIKHLSETTGLGCDPVQGLRCGAAVTLKQVAEQPEVRRYFPLLAEVCEQIGSPQLRNRATLGGSICSASPASSLAPALLCYDAVCHLFGPQGKRSLPLSEFFTGPHLTALSPGEILTQITLPMPARTTRAVYNQVRIGQSGHTPVAGVAVAATIDSERQTIWRLALTAVAPYPFRVRPAEELLSGPLPTSESLVAAAAEIQHSCQPIDDHRASAAYRRAMVAVLARRSLEELTGQLAGVGP